MEASGPAPLSPLSAFPPPVMRVNDPPPGPTFEASGDINVDSIADFLDNDLFADENPAPSNGVTSSGYRSVPGTPPAGDKNLDGGASAEN